MAFSGIFISLNIFFNGKTIGTYKYNNNTGNTLPPEISYLHLNYLGTPAILTNENATTTQVIKRDIWGSISNNSYNKEEVIPTSVGYTGHKWDADSDLTYAHARYLNTNNRVWLSNDPMSITGFNSDYFLVNPQFQNSYSYASNNPVNNIDPDGKAVEDLDALAAMDDVYSNFNVGSTIDRNWQLTYTESTWYGYKKNVYERNGSDGLEVMRAYRGTRPAYLLPDWTNDVLQVIGLNFTISKAYSSQDSLVKCYAPSVKIVNVGHSEGGAIASSKSIKNNENGIIANSAKPSIIGNGLYFPEKSYTGNIRNITVQGEPLTAALGVYSAPYVTQVTLPYVNTSVNYGSNYNPYNLVRNLYSSFNSFMGNHSVQTVTSQYKKNQ